MIGGYSDLWYENKDIKGSHVIAIKVEAFSDFR